VFVPGQPFRASLIFSRLKAERCFTWEGSGLGHQHMIMLLKLARVRNSSFLGKLINYGCKMFYNIGPGVDFMKLFTPVIYKFSEKATDFEFGKPSKPSLKVGRLSLKGASYG
jgi:hypothetical protein